MLPQLSLFQQCPIQSQDVMQTWLHWRRQDAQLVQKHFLVNVCILIWRVVIGASLSEPHTSESNGGFFIYCIFICRAYSVNAS